MKLAACVVAMLSVIGYVAATGGEVQAAQKKGVVPLTGKELFKLRCSGCHAMDTDGKGPRLRGVYGRRAGAIQWPEYSSGMRTANFAWDDYRLNNYLTDPDSVISVSNMNFKVRKKEEREAIIEFLKSDEAR